MGVPGFILLILGTIVSYVMHDASGVVWVDWGRPIFAYLTARILFHLVFPDQSKAIWLCATLPYEHAHRLEAAASLSKRALTLLRKGMRKVQNDQR